MIDGKYLGDDFYADHEAARKLANYDMEVESLDQAKKILLSLKIIFKKKQNKRGLEFYAYANGIIKF